MQFKLGFLYCAFHGGVLDRTLDEYWGCGLNWGAVIFRDFTVHTGSFYPSRKKVTVYG